MRVIYCPTALYETFREGVTNGTIVDADYIVVSGQPLHRAFVFLDTPENRAILENYQDEYKAWKSLEPNPHAYLNRLRRP